MKDNKLVQAVFEMSNTRAEKNDEGMTIRGYAAVFEKLSVPILWFREKIQRNAFEKSLKSNQIKALWNHNSDKVLGSTKAKTLSLEEDDKGLRFEMTLPDTQAGRDAYTLVNRGDVDQMSFGFMVKGEIWDESNPKKVIRTLTEIDLREISITPFPAYKQTSAKTRSIKEDYEDYKQEKRSKEDNEKEIEKRKNELDIRIKKLKIEL